MSGPTDADRELAAAIRVALYRAVPNMPSYPPHLIAETIAAHREQAWLDARDAEFDDRWNARMNP